MAFAVFLALLWLQFFLAAAPSWSAGGYYDYGWLVPPVVAFFFWRRWQDAGPVNAGEATPRWWWLVVAAGVLLMAPLRIIEHVDIYWRLPLWLHAVLVVAITHGVVAACYGGRTSASLWPVTLLLFLALPLPSVLELRMVHGLTREVVQLAASAMPIAGYPVELAGNTLVVKGEALDVAEGCSGIRSFQSSAMAAICLGELLRLGPWRRLALVAGAVALAVVWNAGRIVVLARLVHNAGKEAMDAAHDGIGVWMLILTYGGIALLAWFLSRIDPRRRVRVRTVGAPPS